MVSPLKTSASLQVHFSKAMSMNTVSLSSNEVQERGTSVQLMIFDGGGVLLCMFGPLEEPLSQALNSKVCATKLIKKSIFLFIIKPLSG